MSLYADSEDNTLIGSGAQAALRKRGRELVGLAMLLVALAIALCLATYNPDDPSFFNATGAAATNLLGAPGAWIADALMKTLAWASWGIVLFLAVWGLRHVLHRGETRIWTRIVAAPFALIAGAMFASLHAPLTGWPSDFGLGGVIGDTSVSGLLQVLPIDPVASLKTVTVALGLVMLGLTGFALGLDRRETAVGARYLGRGVRTGLYALVSAIAAGASRGYRAAKSGEAAGRSARYGKPPAFGARLRAKRAEETADPALEEEERAEPYEEPAAKRGPLGAFGRLAQRKEPTIGDEDELIARINAKATLAAGDPAETVDEDAYDEPRATVEHPVKKIARKSRQARREEQPTLALDGFVEEDAYDAPPLSLLQNPTEIVRHQMSDEALEENARMLEAVLDDYGIRGEIVSVRPGPVVTMYELEPAPGLKASRVIGLADDIARSMSALAARVSTVPGRSVIGIELPNAEREKVILREILSAKAFGDASYKLPLALGKDIAGQPVVANLARMPHLLIAGTTGSGKSVAINTMILSLLYRLSPKECRLIMIDPKMLELSVYDGIPHLLSPVVTDPKKAVVALKWVVAEMEERYRKMSKLGVRNIEGYNARVRDAIESGEGFTRTVQTGFDDETGEPIFEQQEFEPEEMPMIVVIVDEMADLMMVAGKEIEACIQRLAQMARASGIHLIMATQRPSVDVITGTIKANFPTRISFQVTSKIDSRTILGEQGAEQLLGMGDMLYMAGGGRITRVHGPFVSDREVEKVVGHLKTLGQPDYEPAVTEGVDDEAAVEIDQVLGLGSGDGDDAALYDQAVAIVARDRKCSTSYIQRKLAIGYNKAARLVEQMEEQGVVSPANHVGKREVLVGEI